MLYQVQAARGNSMALRSFSASSTARRHHGICLDDRHRAAAIRAYERIGFQTGFRYYEGVAARVGNDLARF